MSAQLAMDLGAKKRDAGHADALSHYVCEAVQLTIVEVSERLPEFTADDVRDALPASTRASLASSPNALGALFRRMAVCNAIRDTGKMVRTRSDEGRKRKIVVWRRA